jgi:hypothetical protein
MNNQYGERDESARHRQAKDTYIQRVVHVVRVNIDDPDFNLDLLLERFATADPGWLMRQLKVYGITAKSNGRLVIRSR